MKYARILTLLLALLMPRLAYAADGSGCATAATDFDVLGKGHLRPVWCVTLCDNLTSNADCTNFDLNGVGGIPEVIAFELHEVDIDLSSGPGDCTAGTLTINTSFNSGLTTASENAFDIASTTALTVGGTNRIILWTSLATIDRYIMVTSTNLDANCTNDGVDVLMIGYEALEP